MGVESERKKVAVPAVATELSAPVAESGPAAPLAMAPLAHVQRRLTGSETFAEPTSDEVHALAAKGTSGGGQALPFADRIQQAFGRHDVSQVRAFTGGAARQAARGMGADAYATGNLVAFGKTPDLHTAAHEAAHVIQQRAGVHLSGGVGQDGDVYERHAEEVAARVVRGKSVEGHLDRFARTPVTGASDGVQMAGHDGVMIFGNVGNDPVVLKRVEPTEASQYWRVRTEQSSGDPVLNARANRTFPRVYAIYNDLSVVNGQFPADKLRAFRKKHGNGDKYVLIASVKGAQQSSIKDFKIGTHTTNAAELILHNHKSTWAKADEKVAREDISDTLTETRQHGIRDSDEVRKVSKGAGVYLGKKFGSVREFLSANTMDKVKSEIRDGGTYAANASVFGDLDTIRDYITDSDTVYVASSLVMDWSSDRMQRDVNDKVRLIDLAHPIARGANGFDEAKAGMLLGVQNMRNILSGLPMV